MHNMQEFSNPKKLILVATAMAMKCEAVLGHIAHQNDQHKEAKYKKIDFNILCFLALGRETLFTLVEPIEFMYKVNPSLSISRVPDANRQQKDQQEQGKQDQDHPVLIFKGV